MPPSSIEQKNILLINVHQKNREALRQLLKQINGITFDWADNYKIGLETLSKNEHDLYLVDYDMLGKTKSLKFLQQAIENNCQAPIIILMEQIDPNLHLELTKAGATDTLPKQHLSPLLWERSIQYAIERKHITDELKQSEARFKAEIAERQRLEQRINESLNRRARQVQTSTEVAQEIATTPKLDELFRQVVNLVQRRFGYYHAHVYTLEDDSLVVQEGTGETGRKLKQAEHQIPLYAEKSLVAQTARSGQPILVSDVYQEANWLPNPFLPETKSELAVPIKLRDEVYGVLDVQSDKVGSLNQEDQILLMGLCGQIAIAIHNSRLSMARDNAEKDQQKLIEELDAFAHTVGYNLREPLALIIGYTELLREQARLPEEFQVYLNAIARNGHKLSTIIDELQLLAGVRRAEVKLTPLNMTRIVAEVQQRLAYLIAEFQAKIIVSEYWPVALGHKPWVEEVWANYISNAIRHGGQPPRVHIGATAQSNGMVRFWVKDNGPGLSKEEQAQLFDEFTHLNQVHMKGYGLGLSIAQRIVTKLGGQVSVESEGIVGKGCIFSFTLPEYKT